MGIQHLRVVGNSNLVVCQAKGSFPYRDISLENGREVYTFGIEHAQRSENKYANALAMLGMQITIEGSSTTIEIKKRK